MKASCMTSRSERLRLARAGRRRRLEVSATALAATLALFALLLAGSAAPWHRLHRWRSAWPTVKTVAPAPTTKTTLAPTTSTAPPVTRDTTASAPRVVMDAPTTSAPSQGVCVGVAMTLGQADIDAN